MEINGEHRLPAAPTRVWDALHDPRTVGSCLPAGVALRRDAAARLVGLASPVFEGPVALVASSPPDHVSGAGGQASFRLGADDRTAHDVDALLDQEGTFTRLRWRWRAPDEVDAARITAAIDGFLARLGQHAAVPVTVAADGLSGVATAALEAATPARTSYPLAPLLDRVAAWPREVAIGGALFLVAAAIVVGLL